MTFIRDQVARPTLCPPPDYHEHHDEGHAKGGHHVEHHAKPDLLKGHEHDAYVPFREELSFTHDYLGIEVVRFGAEKLRVVQEIDPETLELLVPCMLLQPLIEGDEEVDRRRGAAIDGGEPAAQELIFGAASRGALAAGM